MSVASAGCIRVPGKLILMGEYAVRNGSPAVVMAVDRLARVAPGPAAAGDLVDLTIRACGRYLGLAEVSSCRVDTTAFSHQGSKLGLGSSAAAVVGATAHVFDQAGRDLRDADTRLEMWQLAKGIHDRFQGTPGSGLDLAAAIFGGLVIMRGRRPLSGGRFLGLKRLSGLALVFAWTGEPASTAERLLALDALQRRDPETHAGLLGRMDTLAEAFAAVVESGGPPLLPLIDAYGVAMRRLGQAIGLPVETPLMTELIAAARREGGAAKPSGAGGGDFLVAAFPEPAAAARFAKTAHLLGAWPMDFLPVSDGVGRASGSS